MELRHNNQLDKRECRSRLCYRVQNEQHKQPCSDCVSAAQLYERFENDYPNEVIFSLTDLEVTKRRLANVLLNPELVKSVNYTLLADIFLTVNHVRLALADTEFKDEFTKLMLLNCNEVCEMIDNISFYASLPSLKEVED